MSRGSFIDRILVNLVHLAHVLTCRRHCLRQRALSRILQVPRRVRARHISRDDLARDKLLMLLWLTLRRQPTWLAFKIPRILLGLHMPLVVVKSSGVRHLIGVRVLRAVQPVERFILLPVEPGLC